MQWALQRDDGGVTIKVQYPVAVVEKSSGTRFEPVSVNEGTIRSGGFVWPFSGDVRDLAPDTIDGLELIFTNIEAAIAKSRIGPHVLSYDRITVADLPESETRTFRNAWTVGGGKPVVDMAKARELWRRRMRQARKQMLEALDIEMTKHIDDPTSRGEIEADRQALRDVTDDPAIESARTPDDLKQVWPAVLGDKPER